MLDWRYVDTSSVVKIKKDLPEGYYACVENGGEIVIRNLKEESKQWGGARTDVYDLIEDGTDYPYGLSWNIQYMEMYHWGESAPFRCDYEKKGCYIKSDDKVVVDVGANIGIFTRLALERGVEKVYAFEPSFDANLVKIPILAPTSTTTLSSLFI
jgi:hypothetical protein